MIQVSFCLRRRGGLFASHMAAESARRGEFAQSVADHVLGNIDRNVSTSIMNSDRVSNHLGENNACATPGPQDLLFASLVHGLNSFQ